MSESSPFELPTQELDKLRKVLRLREGDLFAVLPNNGSMLICSLQGREAVPIKKVMPSTESKCRLTLAIALPKQDRLETIVRSCTEVGVTEFVIFPSERSVVRWDESKKVDRLRRLETIAREACEQSFRTVLPRLEFRSSLKDVLASHPHARVLSESEAEQKPFLSNAGQDETVVVGPEGGWSPSEVREIGDRGFTLGPRVLRVDTAAITACALVLLPDVRR